MVKKIVIAFIVLFLLGGTALAVDPPHGSYDCTQCHSLHGALGPGLTNAANNANLCMSTCHNAAGDAQYMSFNDLMMATPGVSGSSHRWDTAIDPATCFPNDCGPNSTYGVRKPAADADNPQPDEIQTKSVNLRLQQFNYVITCSVCHDQHSQGVAAWNPGALDIVKDSGTASGGSTLTVQDTSKNWSGVNWADDYKVKMTGGSNNGQVRVIQSNNIDTLTVTSAFSTDIVNGDTYIIMYGSLGDDGIASGGTTTVIEDTDSSKAWSTDIWAGFYVRMLSGSNADSERVIQSNTGDTITVTTAFDNAVANTDEYFIYAKRHFQRTENDLNQLCEDCHYYRVQTHTNIEGPTDGTNVYSHPVTQTLNANSQGYDRAAPLDADGNAQSGTRFATGSDTNDTNDFVVGSDNTIRCLTCHRVHYSDSNSLTNDDGP